MTTGRFWRTGAAGLVVAMLAAGCGTQGSWMVRDGQSFRLVRTPQGQEQEQESDAIEQAWQELEAAEGQYGPDHPEVALLLEHLAALHKELGDYAEAERLYGEALGLAERLYWPEHPEVGKACNNLAVAYDLQGNIIEAERFFKRALSVLAKSTGLDSADTLVVLDNLGDFYTREGRYKDAETVLKRLVQLRREALGRAHPDTRASEADLDNLRSLVNRKKPKPAARPDAPIELEVPVGW